MEFLTVGDRKIAVERRIGRSPGLFWLGGYHSDMQGAKALAVDGWGDGAGHAVTRFDYFGHGQSPGDIYAGSISGWLEEAFAVFATTDGPQLVIGSSMGGWLALLLVRALRRRGEHRVKGLILIAPATDMTEALMWDGFSKKQRKQFEADGYVEYANDYGAPYRLTRTLIQDGRQHLLLGRTIETGCPVTILQGGRDRDVPKEHALKLLQHILSDPVAFTLIPDGDHRLSRPEDLTLLRDTIGRMMTEIISPPELPPEPDLFKHVKPNDDAGRE
jgi:pimeloyl-ACP methyl ester carboxylesterase